MMEVVTMSVPRFSRIAFALLIMAASGWSQLQLPDGPGRAELEKLCRNCHEVARSVSKQQDRDGWLATMTKMVAFGMKGTEEEHKAIVDYLTLHFGADALPPIRVNEAAAIELESSLGLRRSQVAALIAYREKHGKFKSLADLKKVPGIEAAKIEAKKDRIVF
jgi:competence protein ComEA